MTKMSSSKGDIVVNLNEVKDVINQALTESMTEVKNMLEGIEARLKKEPVPVIDPSGTAEPSGVTSNSDVAEIVGICEVAGMPELAGTMIRDGLTIDKAKKRYPGRQGQDGARVNGTSFINKHPEIGLPGTQSVPLLELQRSPSVRIFPDDWPPRSSKAPVPEPPNSRSEYALLRYFGIWSDR
ncbi:MAG: hypothetical protein V1844_19660 [Pseudomonadota bacterium]